MNLKEFEQSGMSLHIEKEGKILFQSNDHMLKPLVEAIDKFDLSSSTVFDKRIGRGAALLFVYSKVKEVFTLVASKNALEVLRKNKISITTNKIVDNLMNSDGTDICYMEKLSAGKSPEEFYSILRSRAEQQ